MIINIKCKNVCKLYLKINNYDLIENLCFAFMRLKAFYTRECKSKKLFVSDIGIAEMKISPQKLKVFWSTVQFLQSSSVSILVMTTN